MDTIQKDFLGEMKDDLGPEGWVEFRYDEKERERKSTTDQMHNVGNKFIQAPKQKSSNYQSSYQFFTV